MMVNRFRWHSAYAKREEKKEIINQHKIEVKNTVDIDAILKKAINKGIDQLDDSPKQVHWYAKSRKEEIPLYLKGKESR